MAIIEPDPTLVLRLVQTILYRRLAGREIGDMPWFQRFGRSDVETRGGLIQKVAGLLLPLDLTWEGVDMSLSYKLIVVDPGDRVMRIPNSRFDRLVSSRPTERLPSTQASESASQA